MVTFRGRPGPPPTLAWQHGLSVPILANRRGLRRAESYDRAWLEAAAIGAPRTLTWQQPLSAAPNAVKGQVGYSTNTLK